MGFLDFLSSLMLRPSCITSNHRHCLTLISFQHIFVYLLLEASCSEMHLTVLVCLNVGLYDLGGCFVPVVYYPRLR